MSSRDDSKVVLVPVLTVNVALATAEQTAAQTAFNAEPKDFNRRRLDVAIEKVRQANAALTEANAKKY